MTAQFEQSPPVTLYREIDALGGSGEGERHEGYSEALGDVLTILEKRGFSEPADAIARVTRFSCGDVLPCPNPWCAPSPTLLPTLIWQGFEATVECASCGMQGPSVSPVIVDQDGERLGTRDAEGGAILAWNSRPDITAQRSTAEPSAIADEVVA